MINEEPGFIDLCNLFQEIEKESSRLIKINYYTTFLRKLINKKTLISTLYLSSNLIFPQFENQELNIGESILLQVVSEYRGIKINKIREELRLKGDFGELVMFTNIKPLFLIKKNPLTIQEVHEYLKKICKVSGVEVNKIKSRLIFECIKRTTKGIERKYLFRFLEGKLKIGLALQTILVGISNIFSEKILEVENNEDKEVKKKLKNNKKTNLKDYEEIVKTAYNRTLSFELLIDNLINYGIKDLLNYCNVTPGIPLKPMLAKACKSIDDIFEKIKGEEFCMEYKYDGERIQIHKKDNKIGLFSRNCENLISKYPDLKEIILKLNEKDFILDCEIVAYDFEKNEIKPFQVLSTRKRKVEKESDIKINICIFCFDILFFNNNSTLENTLNERKNILFNNFIELKNFKFVTFRNSGTKYEIESFFNEALKTNAEGLMIKKLFEGSEYAPSKRSCNWLKLKKDYLEGIDDTLDLTVLGSYYGKGKRTGWYGGFLLGSYNDITEKFESVCKIGTGFSEELLEKFKIEFEGYLSKNKPTEYLVSEKIKPDIWINPKFIWEIKAAEYSLSPIYDSGRTILNGEKGISLRFPRFLRERDDKDVYDSTTSDKIYKNYIDNLSSN